LKPTPKRQDVQRYFDALGHHMTHAPTAAARTSARPSRSDALTLRSARMMVSVIVCLQRRVAHISNDPAQTKDFLCVSDAMVRKLPFAAGRAAEDSPRLRLNMSPPCERRSNNIFVWYVP
jgi:hypothetical protein